MSVFIKLFLSVLGVILMILGVVITPLPGPFGVPVILLGLILLLRNSTWVKRLFIRLVQRYPRVMKPIRGLLRPGAKVIALMWLHTLRIERRILSRRLRFMYRLRHELRGLLRHRHKSQMPVTLSDSARGGTT